MLICNDHEVYRVVCLCGKSFAAHLWRRWWLIQYHREGA